MSKESPYLRATEENKFQIVGKQINSALLEDGQIAVNRTSIYDLLYITINDIIEYSNKSIIYTNLKKKPVTAFLLKDVPKILWHLNKTSKDERVLTQVKDVLKELAYQGLKAVTGEKEITEEAKKQPTFDQLLGALMKVPPPKK